MSFIDSSGLFHALSSGLDSTHSFLVVEPTSREAGN